MEKPKRSLLSAWYEYFHPNAPLYTKKLIAKRFPKRSLHAKLMTPAPQCIVKRRYTCLKMPNQNPNTAEARLAAIKLTPSLVQIVICSGIPFCT